MRNDIMAAVKSEVQSSQEDLTGNLTKDSKNRLHSLSQHIIRKRLPPRLPKSERDIYVTNKTNFKAQLTKCEKLLDSGESEIVIHGLGAAVSRACNLALQLKENHHGTVDLDTNTSTVDIIDDFEPITDDADYEVNRRQSSAIHIRVFRTALIGPGGWSIVFSPLFIADGLNTYFCAIIFIRMQMEGIMKSAILRALWSLTFLLLVFVFKYLLCKKLSGQSSLEYSEVLSPVFILLQLIAVRACQLH